MRAVPEELDELIAAEQLGVGLQELRDMPWDDVQDVMAFRRGADIAAVSRPPGADRRIASDADHTPPGRA